MSEKLKLSHQPEQIQPNPAELQFTPETGAIRFDGLSAAFHGLRSALSEKRADWAEARLNHIDRKDDLYDVLSDRAIERASTPSSGSPQPSTFFERFMDRRMEKSIRKAERAEVRQNRTRKAFGGKENVNTMGLRTSLSTVQRSRSVRREYKDGTISVQQEAVELERVKGTPRGFESSAERKARRGLSRAEKRAENSLNQPFASRWRDWRRNEATKDVQRHTRNANKHRRRQADALSS